MVRTIITLEDVDKKWLDRYSERSGRPTAETIRLAIKEFQKKTQSHEYQHALKASAGILKGAKVDSVKFVRKIREEWD